MSQTQQWFSTTLRFSFSESQTAGSGDASLRAKHGAADQSIRGSAMCKRACVLRGGGETPARAASPRVGGTWCAESPSVIRKSDDEDLWHEGPAARQAFDLGKEYMAKYQFEMAISCFNAGINLAPKSARLYTARAEAYHKINKMEQSLQDSMHVVAIKEQAAARMSSPTRTTFLGERASADAGADEMLCSRPQLGPDSEVEVREREKLMGSLQLMADLMTRHPTLAQDEACSALTYCLSELARDAANSHEDQGGRQRLLQEGLGRQLQEARGEISRLTQLLDSQGNSAQQLQQTQSKLQMQAAAREEQVETLTSRLSQAKEASEENVQHKERVNELMRKMREMEEREARLLHDARFASQLQAALEEQIRIKEAAISDMALAISEGQNKIQALQEMTAIKMKEKETELERGQEEAHNIRDPGLFLSDIARASLQVCVVSVKRDLINSQKRPNINISRTS